MIIVGDLMMNDIFEKYLDLLRRYEVFNKNKIPLCAAENYMSDFSREPLSGLFEGKYNFGGSNYNKFNDFVGGEYINELIALFKEQCQKIFDCQYSDARTLTGMNCFAIVSQCLLKRGDKVLLTTPNQGGHPSIPLILAVLGVSFDEIPYDYDNYSINYKATNELLAKNKYKAIIFCQSDLINEISFAKFKISDELILFDATQTLGMIAAKIHQNPLKQIDNIVVFGGAHKTLPGPSCGLILCNKKEIIQKLDTGISPDYLRNIQPNHIESLLRSLFEFESFGTKYMELVVQNCNSLGKLLENEGFNIAKCGDKYSYTHQLFILTNEEEMNTIYRNAIQWGVTLNKKQKPLFRGCGIRIGLQEASRYGWGEKEMIVISQMLSALKSNDYNLLDKTIPLLCKKKNDAFSLCNFL